MPNPFHLTQTCRSGVHCSACRSGGDDGRMFRASAAKAFGLAADFACPYGRAWGEYVPPPPPPTPEDVAAGEQRVRDAWARLGPVMWGELHTRRDADQAFVEDFTNRILCGECRRHWREMLARTPPVFGEGWFEWTYERHEEVNRRLAKPSMSLSEARERWQAVAAT